MRRGVTFLGLGSLATAAVLMLAATATAHDDDDTVVVGAGRSASAGSVLIVAEGDENRARGRFRARNTEWGNLRGRVLCIDDEFMPGFATVIGKLNRPVVEGEFTFPYFAFQVVDRPNGTDWARTTPIAEPAFSFSDCGQSLWFDVFWDFTAGQGTGHVEVTRGNFVVVR